MLTSSSFGLQKLTRSMEMRSNSFSKDLTLHTPRLSAMNSVAKSVKYNNLSFITGQQLCKLRRQPQEGIQDPEYSVAHTNMSNIRKRYDKTNQQKLYLENKIQRLNQQKMKFAQVEQELQQNKNSGKQKVTDMQSQLESIRLQLLDKEFQKRSIQQMTEVIKHDKIIYDKRKYDMDKYLQHLQFKNKTVKQEYIHKNQEDDRVVKVYDKLLTRLGEQQKQRSQHLSSMEFRVMQKQKVNNSSVLRKSQMGQIAEQAMTDRDPEEKSWVKVFLTHKCLDKMLKCKIQREMQKFSMVQDSFKTIKIATGVSDAKTMVKKFLTKQEIYGDLLSKITSNEKQIQQLKKQQQKYFKQIKKHEEQINLLEINKNVIGNFREELKQAEYFEQKRQKCDIGEQKLKQFLFKQFKQLKKEIKSKNSQGSRREDFNFRTREQLKINFIDYLDNFSVLIEQSSKLEFKDSTGQQIAQGLNEEQTVSKIFRVKVWRQVSKDEFMQNFEQEQLTAASDQTQAVDQQRLNLIKGNQKFMRQLKLKREQAKQLMVQTLVKNTKQKAAPVPVKKVQVPQQL